MAKIRIDTAFTIADGAEVSFTAPCDCTAIDGLIVYYPGGSKAFTFKDAHSNNLTGIGNLFKSGAIVKALLDVKNGHAYLQNADTNKYIEENFLKKGSTKPADIGAASLIDAGVYNGDLNVIGEGGVPVNSVVWVTPETGNMPYGDWGYVETWRAQFGGEIQRYTSLNGITYIRTRYHNGISLDWHSGWVRIDSLNSAPSGFGLGDAVLISMATLDNQTRPGWYYSNEYATIAGFDSSRWWLHVNGYGNGATYATQELYSFTRDVGVKFERHKVNGAWSAWSRASNVTCIKLWENASRTSSFAAQTISLDLSAFDEVLVYSCLEGSRYNDYMVVSRCPVGETLLSHYQWADDGVALHRNATTRTNGIEFNNAYHGGGLDNASVIPYRIYGIKGGSI